MSAADWKRLASLKDWTLLRDLVNHMDRIEDLEEIQNVLKDDTVFNTVVGPLLQSRISDIKAPFLDATTKCRDVTCPLISPATGLPICNMMHNSKLIQSKYEKLNAGQQAVANGVVQMLMKAGPGGGVMLLEAHPGTGKSKTVEFFLNVMNSDQVTFAVNLRTLRWDMNDVAEKSQCMTHCKLLMIILHKSMMSAMNVLTKCTAEDLVKSILALLADVEPAFNPGHFIIVDEHTTFHPLQLLLLLSYAYLHDLKMLIVGDPFQQPSLTACSIFKHSNSVLVNMWMECLPDHVPTGKCTLEENMRLASDPEHKLKMEQILRYMRESKFDLAQFQLDAHFAQILYRILHDHFLTPINPPDRLLAAFHETLSQHQDRRIAYETAKNGGKPPDTYHIYVIDESGEKLSIAEACRKSKFRGELPLLPGDPYVLIHPTGQRVQCTYAYTTGDGVVRMKTPNGLLLDMKPELIKAHHFPHDKASFFNSFKPVNGTGPFVLPLHWLGATTLAACQGMTIDGPKGQVVSIDTANSTGNATWVGLTRVRNKEALGGIKIETFGDILYTAHMNDGHLYAFPSKVSKQTITPQLTNAAAFYKAFPANQFQTVPYETFLRNTHLCRRIREEDFLAGRAARIEAIPSILTKDIVTALIDALDHLREEKCFFQS